jgi:hypothetical protein
MLNVIMLSALVLSRLMVKIVDVSTGIPWDLTPLLSKNELIRDDLKLAPCTPMCKCIYFLLSAHA